MTPDEILTPWHWLVLPPNTPDSIEARLRAGNPATLRVPHL